MKQVLVSTEEAIKISSWLTVTKVEIAERFRRAFLDACKTDPSLIPEFATAAVFEAGRVQGIREERMKKARVS